MVLMLKVKLRSTCGVGNDDARQQPVRRSSGVHGAGMQGPRVAAAALNHNQMMNCPTLFTLQGARNLQFLSTDRLRNQKCSNGVNSD